MSSISKPNIEVVCEHKCLLAEGPVWDHKRKVICWIDILNGCVHEFNPQLNSHKTLTVNEMIGSFALCKDGHFIAALQSGFAFIDRNTSEKTMINDPESNLPNNRFNDGKCDPSGRFWAGTMSLSEDAGAGSLYVLDHDLTCSRKIEGVTISNGMAWSSDHRKFYYIDTPTNEVVVYDYDEQTNLITNKKSIIKIIDGHPDGMTIDEEGMLWIAHWEGWQVSRWNPQTGEQLLSIKMPVARITSCTFGGENLNDLYLTSAKVDLTNQQLKEQPLAGSLFVIRNCGYKGLPAVEFEGNY